MIGDIYISLSVHLHITIKVFSLNQIKSYLRNALIKIIRELSSHYSEQPSEGHSNANWIACDLALTLMTSYKIEKSLLLVCFSFSK